MHDIKCIETMRGMNYVFNNNVYPGGGKIPLFQYQISYIPLFQYQISYTPQMLRQKRYTPLKWYPPPLIKKIKTPCYAFLWCF